MHHVGLCRSGLVRDCGHGGELLFFGSCSAQPGYLSNDSFLFLSRGGCDWWDGRFSHAAQPNVFARFCAVRTRERLAVYFLLPFLRFGHTFPHILSSA